MSRCPDIAPDTAAPHSTLTLEDICHIYINTRSKYNYENLYIRQFYQRMNAHVLPYIGFYDVQDINSSIISLLFHKINEKTQRRDAPYKVLGQLYQVFDYAIDRQFYNKENPIQIFIFHEINKISQFDNNTINYLKDFIVVSENDDSIESVSARIAVLTAIRLRLLLSLKRVDTIINKNIIIKTRHSKGRKYQSFRAIPKSAEFMFRRLTPEGIFIFCSPEAIRPIGQRRIYEHFSKFNKLQFHMELLPFVFDRWVSANFGNSHIVDFIRESDLNLKKNIDQQVKIIECWNENMRSSVL